MQKTVKSISVCVWLLHLYMQGRTGYIVYFMHNSKDDEEDVDVVQDDHADAGANDEQDDYLVDS